MSEPNRATRRRVLRASGAVLVGGITGCSTSSASQSTQEGDLPDRVDVTMKSIPSVGYEPEVVHVAVGGTVVWTLESGSHDTTAYHPDTKPPRRLPEGVEAWASQTMSSVGATFEWTFDEPGVYDYIDTEAVCTSHASIGAMARVIVGWPDAENQPGLAPPQEGLPDLVQSKIRKHNPPTHELLEAGPGGESRVTFDS